MNSNVKVELAALKHMTPGELRNKRLAVFGEPSRTGNEDFLVKRIGWPTDCLVVVRDSRLSVT